MMSERKAIDGVKHDNQSKTLKKGLVMIKNERSEKILEILDTHTYISVKRLSELLYVSMPTVRRDLSELESQGLIVRSHGGAKKLEDGDYSIPFDFRNAYKTSEKKELCRKAARLVSDGDMIFIDESTTLLCIGEFITAKNVTAVTNGIFTAESLIKNGIRTHLVGGEIFPSAHCTCGGMSEEFVSLFNFDFAFFSAHGVNSNGMIVDTGMTTAALRRAVFKSSKKTVFIYNSEKMGVDAPYNVIRYDSVDYIITD